MQIINYGELEKPIKKIEQLFEDYDPEEQQLIIKYITQRIMMKAQKQKVSEISRDAIGNISPKDIFKLFKKDKDEGKE
jgi:hypothetical protein